MSLLASARSAIAPLMSLLSIASGRIAPPTHACYFALCTFYYSDWARGYVNSTGQGEPLLCPDGRTSLRSELAEYPDLPDVYFLYPDLSNRPGDYYKIWMRDGQVHDASAEQAARYAGGVRAALGESDFPRIAENDREVLFRFFEANQPVATLNLTLCEAPQGSAVDARTPAAELSFPKSKDGPTATGRQLASAAARRRITPLW